MLVLYVQVVFLLLVCLKFCLVRHDVPGTGYCGDFFLWFSVLISCDSLHSPTSLQFEGNILPYDLIFLVDLRRVAFLVCLAFYLLVILNGDF